MLKSLRWKLTLAYLAATLGLLVLVGGSAYVGLRDYFQKSIDLSLMHKMASQLQLFGFPLSEELVEAETEWLETNSSSLPSRQVAAPDQGDGGEDDETAEESGGESDQEGEESGLSHDQHELLENAYGSDLTQVFVMPLDELGNLIFDPNPYALPMQPDLAASQAALSNGNDLRNVWLPDGQHVRLLSYRTGSGEQPAVVQVGRLLVDQDKVLSQLMASTGLVGLLVMVLVGVGSWRLAGRTLLPAQQAWDQQQTFVANASHELRTPLTLMRASTEVALRGDVGQKEKQLLNDVLKETDYMGRLVDDLLLLSRLDSRRIQLQLEPISVKEIFNDLEVQIEKLPSDHISLQTVIGEQRVSGDRTRLRQVLLILLDNAIKHNPDSTRISVGAEPFEKTIEIYVKDEGTGISAGHLEHIFERFYQIQGENKDSHSNGLGLAIARNLIELHGGSIRAASEPGKGSRFTISLPLSSAKL